jgi:hypothetical protein
MLLWYSIEYDAIDFDVGDALFDEVQLGARGQ